MTSISHIATRELTTSALQDYRKRQTERFLKGPIPWTAIQAAAQLPGQCLPIYLTARHMFDLTKTEWVKLSPSVLKGLGVSRDAKSRGLRLLADAGLIELENKPGCAARVKLKS